MLALNCVCPATSTLVTLLVHTSRGRSVTLHDQGPLRLLLCAFAKVKFIHAFTVPADVCVSSMELA